MGIKTRLADNRLQLNGSTFLYNYRNLQLSTVANFGGGPAQTTTNAGKAKVKGVELEAIASPNFHHRLEVSASYLNAYYVEYFPLGSGSLPDYAGRPLDHSPKFVIGAGYTYTYALARGDSISAGVYSRYSDSYVVTAFGTPAQFGQPSYTKTDVNLTYTGNDDRWYTQVFGKNLENKVLVLGVDSFNNVTPGDPRTLGVRAGVKF